MVLRELLESTGNRELIISVTLIFNLPISFLFIRPLTALLQLRQVLLFLHERYHKRSERARSESDERSPTGFHSHRMPRSKSSSRCTSTASSSLWPSAPLEPSDKSSDRSADDAEEKQGAAARRISPYCAG